MWLQLVIYGNKNIKLKVFSPLVILDEVRSTCLSHHLSFILYNKMSQRSKKKSFNFFARKKIFNCKLEILTTTKKEKSKRSFDMLLIPLRRGSNTHPPYFWQKLFHLFYYSLLIQKIYCFYYIKKNGNWQVCGKNTFNCLMLYVAMIILQALMLHFSNYLLLVFFPQLSSSLEP